MACLGGFGVSTVCFKNDTVAELTYCIDVRWVIHYPHQLTDALRDAGYTTVDTPAERSPEQCGWTYLQGVGSANIHRGDIFIKATPSPSHSPSSPLSLNATHTTTFASSHVLLDALRTHDAAIRSGIPSSRLNITAAPLEEPIRDAIRTMHEQVPVGEIGLIVAVVCVICFVLVGACVWGCCLRRRHGPIRNTRRSRAVSVSVNAGREVRDARQGSEWDIVMPDEQGQGVSENEDMEEERGRGRWRFRRESSICAGCDRWLADCCCGYAISASAAAKGRRDEMKMREV